METKMRKFQMQSQTVDVLKEFLLHSGKKVFDVGRKLYYVDFNGRKCVANRTGS